ncbi:uncharacterized protein LOC114325142 isoform X1 [Diabrotica virgifera virgifera]|uniref:Protein Abitram n=1 Tax=Diabrotica virgifera virgifera TaxID=50390 RepID=A0A6P7F009_DIAVI|nr:uncharacterized protein LOC114325142 isoform X1 [Diabrotica virgifera virgifera]
MDRQLPNKIENRDMANDVIIKTEINSELILKSDIKKEPEESSMEEERPVQDRINALSVPIWESVVQNNLNVGFVKTEINNELILKSDIKKETEESTMEEERPVQDRINALSVPIWESVVQNNLNLGFVKTEINNELILKSDIKKETGECITEHDRCILDRINALNVPILQSVPTEVEYNFKFFNEREYVDKFLPIYYENQYEDICLRIHANKIILLTLARGNDIIILNPIRKIQKIDFNVDKSKIKAAGKRKFGAKQVKPNSTICQVKLEEENFTRNIRAGITGYIVEINESVKEDPDLLVRDPKGKGFVAILKLKGQHGQLDEILNNMPLLTEEEYEKTLRDRNETNNAAID